MLLTYDVNAFNGEDIVDLKKDHIFRSNGCVHIKKEIMEDPNFWSNGRLEKKN